MCIQFTRSLNELRIFAPTNHSIHIAADRAHVDIHHAVHAGGPTMFTRRIILNLLLQIDQKDLQIMLFGSAILAAEGHNSKARGSALDVKI